MAENITIVTVFGATGAQGGSVVEALSRDPNYRIRAVTRNPRATSSKKLARLPHIEMVEADLNDEGSIRCALQGADACFLNTVTYFRDTGHYNDEVAQGKRVADICKELGLKKIIYSTIDTEWKESTGMKVKEMDNKIEVFKYMINLDLPALGVMMGFYYENIFNVFAPVNVEENTYAFGLPLGDSHWYLASVQDLGPVVHKILTNWSDEYIGEIVPVIKESLTINRMCEILNMYSEPITFKDLKLTEEQFKGLNADIARQEDIVHLFKLVTVAQTKPTNEKMNCLELHPTMVSFNDWVIQNIDVLLKHIVKEK